MPLKAHKFTQEMRDAIATACVDGGLSPRAARDKAAAGELPNVPVFEMSENYARDLRDAEIERRSVKQFERIDDIAEQGIQMAAAIARDRMAVIRKGQAKRRDKAGFDPAELDRLTTVLKRCQREQAKPSNGKPEPDKGDSTDDPAEQERRALERRLSRATKAKQHTDTNGNADTKAKPKQEGLDNAAKQAEAG